MMLSLPKSALGLAAGISGLLFIGYCIYFDRKRHADPNFKKKLREKRRERRLAKLVGSRIPDLRNQEDVQKFFLKEIHDGEDLLQQGDVDGAVEHLGSAISVCGHPQQLLQVLQQTLPPQVFHVLLQRLPMIGQDFHARHLEAYGAPVGAGGSDNEMPPGFRVVPETSGSVLTMDEDLE